jgi:phosphoribosylformylglycinamidine synthase
VRVRVESRATPFTAALADGAVLRMPVAHGEGRYFDDGPALDELERSGRVVFRYLDDPNGSLRDIAGVCDQAGTVVGLMPHPERASEALLGSADGLLLFRSLVEGVGAVMAAAR